jgi:hypothetical protein
MHQQLLEAKWGKDGSILASACMGYRFSRHFMISQGIGCRFDCYLIHPHAQAAAEYCGNVQQMVQLFEKQLGDVREFVKSGVPGWELPSYIMIVCPTVRTEEFNALYPIGKEMVALFESCEGQCTNPSDCEGWYESADWSVLRIKYSGCSSKDGLHHKYLKPTIVSSIQAVLSLSLASLGSRDFDLSWLDHLPAADDPKLHDSFVAAYSTDVRVLIAEVLEWQGRRKEAIRCALSHSSAHTHM